LTKSAIVGRATAEARGVGTPDTLRHGTASPGGDHAERSAEIDRQVNALVVDGWVGSP
jgi:hypothetical protein